MERRLRGIYFLALCGCFVLLFIPRAPYYQEYVAALSEWLIPLALMGAFFGFKVRPQSRTIIFFSLSSAIYLTWMHIGQLSPDMTVSRVDSGPNTTLSVEQPSGQGTYGEEEIQIVPQQSPIRRGYSATIGNKRLESDFPILNERSLGGDIPESKWFVLQTPSGAINLAYLSLQRPSSRENHYLNRVTIRRLATYTRHSEEPWIIVAPTFSSFLGRGYNTALFSMRVDDPLLGTGWGANWLVPMLFQRTSNVALFVRNLAPSIKIDSREVKITF